MKKDVIQKKSAKQLLASMKRPVPHISLWKVLGIIAIMLFMAIVAGGILRAIQFHASFTPPSDVQIAAARAAVASDLAAREGNLSGFTWRIPTRTHPLAPRAGPDAAPVGNGTGGQALEVFVYNDTVRYGYIIDASSGKILVYSKTVFSDGMQHPLPDKEGDRSLRGIFGGFAP